MKLLAATATIQPPRAGSRSRAALPLLGALLLLLAAMLVAAGSGKAAIPLDLQVQILGRRLLGLPFEVVWPASAEAILLEIRLPRVALAALVGGALALAGAGYQGLFRNPLADPYLLGIASGAGLGAVLAFVLPLPSGLYGFVIVQAMAFLGAAVTVAGVYLLASGGRTMSITSLLLAGVALGAIANAITAALMYLHGDKMLVIYSWLLGGFNVATWRQVLLVAPGVLASGLVLALCGRSLNLLQLGEEQAASLGVEVERVKLILVIAATLATAAAVSAAGLIGFVGLVVPHVTRLLLGPDYRRLVPVAALLGAAFLLAADTVARALPGPAELPVGVITAACGAPFFLVLLRRARGRIA